MFCSVQAVILCDVDLLLEIYSYMTYFHSNYYSYELWAKVDDQTSICSVLAAKNLSEVAYNNFLDHTFLGDRKTTIREYLATTGSGIMEEEPPESLKTRYGG